MANIPNEFIVRCVVNVVYGNGEFYRTQTRGQVAGVARTLLDDVLAQLAAITRQLVDLKTFQVGGRIDTIEQFVFYMLHCIVHSCWLHFRATNIRLKIY